MPATASSRSYDGDVAVFENTGATANDNAFRAVGDNGSTVSVAEVTPATHEH